MSDESKFPTNSKLTSNIKSFSDALLQEKMPSPPPYMEQPRVVMQPQPIVLDNPPGDQFMMSIFTTFCCFMPLGLIALIKSMEVCLHTYRCCLHDPSNQISGLTVKCFNAYPGFCLCMGELLPVYSYMEYAAQVQLNM